jgi:glycerol uptake facilitator-like aquaporin
LKRGFLSSGKALATEPKRNQNSKRPLSIHSFKWPHNFFNGSKVQTMPMNKYLTEFIGTFFLVLTVGCTVIPGNAGVIAPLAAVVSLMTAQCL